MRSFELEILAADRIFYKGECLSLTLPSVDGMYGILAGHENEVVALAIGIAHFTDGNGVSQTAVLSNGICKIEDGKVLLLVETAERPEEIDRLRAERDARDASEAIRSRENASDIKRAKAKMARAAVRISAKDRNEID